jgi:tetratricopeptide (TPR) repeat protein
MPFFMKAECLSKMNQNGESIVWYNKAIEIDDEKVSIWNGKGIALYRLGNFVEARVCFERANFIDPQVPDYLLCAAETAILTGDLDLAINLARDVLNTTADQRAVNLSWGFGIIALFLQQKPKTAVETIDALVKYVRKKGMGNGKGGGRHGAEYDLCGLGKLINKRVTGATHTIVQLLFSYLHGSADIEQLALALTAESRVMTMEDILVEAP